MILCVDPDPSDLAATREALGPDFETVGATSLGDARATLSGDVGVDCVVTEYDLPDGTGLELVREVRESFPDAACIVFTDRPIEQIDTAAFGNVVSEYLRKEGAGGHEELRDLVEHSLAFDSQTAYPLPKDEDARLAALERYAADPEALGDLIDRLTEIATELFGVNSAAVGLVDEHHEQFLSCHGASFDPLDRDASICTYTILEDDVTVVEDVQADPRFEENEGLAAANIRFYAGAPIVTPDGHPIGTFCLQHGESRTFSDRDRELLELFAAETMDQLELRRRLREVDGGESDG
ncbi:MAG: GAF domain-containing protein [Halopenitus sp.]